MDFKTSLPTIFLTTERARPEPCHPMKARAVDLLQRISSQLPENVAARTRGVATAACALVLDTLPGLERLQFGDR